MGLVPELIKLLRDLDCSIKLTPEFSQYNSIFKTDDVKDFIDSLKPPFAPTDEQVRSVYESLRTGRRALLSPTASGKSFIIYCLMRWFMEFGHSSPDRCLIVVPFVGLLKQTHINFINYALNDKINPKKIVSTDRDSDAPVIITTWQGIYERDESYFKDFGCVIGDEVHHFKAQSLQSLMEKCVNAPYRWGLTGTLDDVEVNKMIIEGLFGPVYRVTTTRKLIDKGFLSQMEPIELQHLKYPVKDRKFVASKCRKYEDEIKFLCAFERRNQHIIDQAMKLPGNTLVLFLRVEDHGKILFEMAKSRADHPVYYVSGETSANEREKIRNTINTNDRSTTFGSSGTMATGIDIPNLHNLILAMPGKAKIKLLQSIGRGLRKPDNRQPLRVIDIVDDLTCGTRRNYSLLHAQKRTEIYMKEGFKIRSVPHVL